MAESVVYGAPSDNSSSHLYDQLQQGWSSSRRFRGTVKYFKSEGGYGFLKVCDFQDIFFHIKDIAKCGIEHPHIGDVFFFNVKRRQEGASTKYNARNFELCMLKDQSKREKNGKYKHAEDFSVVERIPTDSLRNSVEIVSKNGEIVSRNVDSGKKKPDMSLPANQKPIKLTSSMRKIGPACTIQPLAYQRQRPNVVSATGPGSAEMASIPESAEVVQLRQLIEKKKLTLRSLDLNKLPDRGRRLLDTIGEMQRNLKELLVKDAERINSLQKRSLVGKENNGPQPSLKFESKKHSVPQPSFNAYALPHDIDRERSLNSVKYETVDHDKKVSQTKITSFSVADTFGTKIGCDVKPIENQLKFPDGPLYGGRMTCARITEVRNITKAAIEDLHHSLKSMPEPGVELRDPDGLNVSLMVHQRQALAWLTWREKQSMSGGILADDMGLGKTLTMISLVLKQREAEGIEDKSGVDEAEIEDFDSSTDSDVILVKDGDDTNFTQVKVGCDSSHKNETKVSELKDSKISDTATSPVNDSGSEPLKKTSSLIQSDSTLIVAPASLLFHWEKEIRNRCDRGLLSIHLFHGSSRETDPKRLAEFDVVITTYDLVRRSSGNVAEKSTLMAICWRRIILDEAHQVKNHKSQSSESVCRLEARSRWAMSGTPVQNNLTDMYAMLKFLHCRPFDEYKVWKNQVDNNSPKGKERLKTLISCIVLRRDKTDKKESGEPLVELPKRNFIMHKLKLGDVEKEVYEKLQNDSKSAYRQFREKGDTKSGKVTATTLLLMLLRLRQCCGHLSLLKDSFDLELLSNEKKELALEDMFRSLDINENRVKMADINVNEYIEEDKSRYFEKKSSSGKVEFVLDELNKLRIEKPGDKCVIVSQWTSMLDVVAAHLDTAKISYVIIKGSVTAKKRMDMVDEFNKNPTNPMVILLSLQAGGVGLNLIGGNHLYLLDMHWNPALESQAFDRIYRVGQKKEVYVHKFVVENTVEERILKLQQHKLDLAKTVMEGAIENFKKLSLQDMKLLFGL